MNPDLAIVDELSRVPKCKDKVYPLEALKTASPPFVFYVRLSQDEELTLDGGAGLMEATYELNCVAKTYKALTVLADDVYRRLRQMTGKAYSGLLIERATVRQTSPDLKERDVGLYRRMYVLRLEYQEEV